MKINKIIFFIFGVLAILFFTIFAATLATSQPNETTNMIVLLSVIFGLISTLLFLISDPEKNN